MKKCVLRIIRSLLLHVWSFFRFSLNFDPVKEVLKIRCHVYFQENTCENEVFRSTILDHRKKLTYSRFSGWFISYSIRKGNLDRCKCSHCKDEAKEIVESDCLCWEVDAMLIASANIPVREGLREASGHPAFMGMSQTISHK